MRRRNARLVRAGYSDAAQRQLARTGKSLSEVCLVLNVDDSHLVSYALKKLRKLGRVDGVKRGKEIHYMPRGKGGTYAENIARFASPTTESKRLSVSA